MEPVQPPGHSNRYSSSTRTTIWYTTQGRDPTLANGICTAFEAMDIQSLHG